MGGTLENFAESSGSTLQAKGSVGWNRLYSCWTDGRGMLDEEEGCRDRGGDGDERFRMRSN